MEDLKQLRKPPQNTDAEKSVIGAVLIDPSAVPTALSRLKSDDFYLKDHTEIYEAITDLLEEGKPIDVITVSDRLSERGTIDRCGGLPYLASLAESVITSANINYYIDIVLEKSILRKLIKVSGEIAGQSFDSSSEVQDVLSFAENQIFGISQSRNLSGLTQIKDILPDVFQNLEEIYKSKGKISGISSGFSDLDRTLSGLNKSDLILIAARPGMGKTSLMLNMARHAAVKERRPVAFFTLEMSKEQLTANLLSCESGVENTKIRNGDIADDEWERLAEGLGELSGAPIFIDDTPSLSITDIKSKCKKLQLEKGVELVFIDYLQLIQGRAKAESRQQEISEISRSLKIMAKELNVPVVTGSQLNREAEKRKDNRPMLSDLRESGAIEQDADIVILLFRDDYYTKEKSEKPNIAELILAKNRHGQTLTVELFYDPRFTKFRDLARE